MQKTVEQIEEQLRIQRIARKELRQMKVLLSEQAGSKVKEAFLDIFRAVRLAAMDISNSLRLAIGMIFTFDPEKITKKIEAFDARRQKINAEWAPIVQRAQEAFKNADPILTMAIIGPANFLALQGIGSSLAAGKTAAEVLTATNWNELVNSFTTTLDVNQSLQQFFQKYSKNEEQRQERELNRIETGGTAGRGRGILSSLSNIFSEGAETGGTLMTEQKSESKGPSPGQKFSEEEAIDIFVKATGMDKSFEKIRKENLQNMKDTIDSIMETIAPMRSSAQLFAANDLKTFVDAFKSAKAKNPKLNDNIFNKFKDTLEKETDKLSKDPKFAEELKKSAGNQKGAATPLSPEQLKDVAGKKVFSVAKEQLDKQLADGLKNAVSAGEKAIESLKIDEDVLKKMKESPYSDAKDVAKVYEELLAVYKEIKSDFESKAKSKATK